MIGRPTLSHLCLHRQVLRSCCPLIPHHTTTQYPRNTFLQKSFQQFSTSRINHDNAPINHYEVLRLPQTATKADLKKQFYALSKETHPDRHPNDPKASERFSQLSESYSILANDEKRRRYDRDFFRQRRSQDGNNDNGNNTGSFAGSRPASGLSKRRGTFRGPPPSFYAQGGYGSSSNRPTQDPQQAAQNEANNTQGGHFNASAFSDRASNFNPQPIHRTQTAEDQRRLQRKAAEIRAMQAEIDALTDSDFWARFVVVTTIILLGITVGGVLVNFNANPRGGMTRGDGSKRGEKANEWAKG